MYSTTVIVTKAKGEGKTVDRHDSLLVFEITDTTTKCGTEGHGYNNVAIVAPELKWKLISLDPKWWIQNANRKYFCQKLL